MRLSRIATASAVAALISFAAHQSFADPAPTTATGSVSGVVTGLDHKPAAGVTVRVGPDTKAHTGTAADGEKKKKSAASLMATTDADGKFKIENVPVGQMTITATLKGVGHGKVSIAVKEGQNADVTIALTPMKAKTS